MMLFAESINVDGSLGTVLFILLIVLVILAIIYLLRRA